jgi:hypothetical protein
MADQKSKKNPSASKTHSIPDLKKKKSNNS